MIYDNVLDAIGGTPLLRLDVDAPDGVEVYAKLELQNLFAMKDRVARNIVLQARREGLLEDGAPIVESSSGTMALGLALVGTALGHPVHIVTDPRIDAVTLAKLTALGCVVHVVEAMNGQGWQGARLERLDEVLKEHPGAFWPQQYANPANPAAYRTLAGELVADLGGVDVLVGAVGSGGSLCGTANALRETQPRLRVVGVDCVGSVLFGQPDQPQRLQSGLGNSLHPRNLDADVVDEIHWLSDAEAYTSTLELAREQQLFAGNTSGSVYRVLREIASRAEPGTRVVGILPDRGDRYSDTVYDPGYWGAKALSEVPYGAKPPRRVRPGAVVSDWSYRVERPGAGRLVFVEANTTGTGMLALRRAAELGLDPLFVTGDPRRYRGLADTGCEVVRCDTHDFGELRSALLATVPADRLAGIATTSEFYLSVVAALSEEFGLPGNSPESIAACRDKAALRRLANDSGGAPVRFEAVGTRAGAVRAAMAVGLPCVVKPVDDSGSSGVLLCASPGEAEAQAGVLLARRVNGRGQPAADVVLVEEYLEGPEFSVEMFSIDGCTVPVGITEKSLAGSPRFVEVRHVYPAALPAEVAEEIYRVAGAAITAAGISTGATHTEVRLTSHGPAVIELNARPAGGMIPDLIRLSSGVDLVEQQIRAFAGLPVDLTPTGSGVAGIRFLTVPQEGVLAGMDGIAAAEAVAGVERVVITAEAGAEVAPAVDAYGRIGYVIARGENRDEVVRALETAAGLISADVHRSDSHRRSA